MAGGFVTVDDRQINAALQRLLQVSNNLEPVFRDIGEYLHISTDARFRAQVDPQGQLWTPLKPSYLAEKPYNQDKILILDGALVGDLHYQASPGEVDFGTSKVYGATHQFGRDEAGIVARPFLGVSAEDEVEIVAIVTQHLRDAM